MEKEKEKEKNNKNLLKADVKSIHLWASCNYLVTISVEESFKKKKRISSIVAIILKCH